MTTKPNQPTMTRGALSEPPAHILKWLPHWRFDEAACNDVMQHCLNLLPPVDADGMPSICISAAYSGMEWAAVFAQPDSPAFQRVRADARAAGVMVSRRTGTAVAIYSSVETTQLAAACAFRDNKSVEPTDLRDRLEHTLSWLASASATFWGARQHFASRYVNKMRFMRGSRERKPLATFGGQTSVVTVDLRAPTPVCIPAGQSEQDGLERAGFKMPLHDVREFVRHYRDGKEVVIKSHKRGSPEIPRKTVVRITSRHARDEAGL